MEEVLESKAIKQAQVALDLQLKEILPNRGPHRLGYRGGGQTLDLYSEGRGRLYYASVFIDRAGTASRYWNAFGLYDGKPHATQRIAVEINIPNPPTRRVAGFFARDPRSGELFLLHDGKIGGGKEGVTRAAFLRHTALQTVQVGSVSREREAIIVARLGSRSLAGDIENFALAVAAFKESLDRD
ncbi:MAG TPA: hypothetical protein VEA60_09670 [Allosphingosinicella sp.]|nr:hypothetical protein [Allosphingosinicella sp.]